MKWDSSDRQHWPKDSYNYSLTSYPSTQVLSSCSLPLSQGWFSYCSLTGSPSSIPWPSKMLNLISQSWSHLSGVLPHPSPSSLGHSLYFLHPCQQCAPQSPHSWPKSFLLPHLGKCLPCCPTPLSCAWGFWTSQAVDFGLTCSPISVYAWVACKTPYITLQDSMLRKCGSTQGFFPSRQGKVKSNAHPTSPQKTYFVAQMLPWGLVRRILWRS